MLTGNIIIIQHKNHPDFALVPGDILMIDKEVVKVLNSEYNPETNTTTVTITRGTNGTIVSGKVKSIFEE